MKGKGILMYDLIVVGAGAGGYTAAIQGAKQGLKVAMIEMGEIGGLCLNRGCIPTKFLIRTASEYRRASDAIEGRFYDGRLSLNYEKIVEEMGKKISSLSSGIQALLKGNGVECFQGRAKLVSSHKLWIDSGVELESKNIIFAAGSVQETLPIKGIDSHKVYTTDQMFYGMKTVPESLVIIGAGIIGLEMAFLFRNLGTQVTLIEKKNSLLESWDKDAQNWMLRILKRNGIKIYLGCCVKEICDDGELHIVANDITNKKRISADNILIAMGRRPNVEGLGLETAGIEFNGRGIETDSNYQTNVKGIYAVGDVNGKEMLAYAASQQALQAIGHIIGEERQKEGVIPKCIFSQPELAMAGIGETDAENLGYDVCTGKFLMTANGRSAIDGHDGFIKIVAEKNTKIILGGVCACHLATELISQISMAVLAKMTIHDFARMIQPHPTYSEALGEAVRMVDKNSIYML